MGLADVRVLGEGAVEARLAPAVIGHLAAVAGELEAAARAELAAQDVPRVAITGLHRLHLRYEGTDAALVVTVPGGIRDGAAAGLVGEIVAGFEAAHRQRFGFIVPDKAHIVEAVSVEVIGRHGTTASEQPAVTLPPSDGPAPEPLARVALTTGGIAAEAPVFRREQLRAGDRVDGPAIIAEATATTIVEPGWRAGCTQRGGPLLTRGGALARGAPIGTKVDPLMLEIFNNPFMSIAEQMGAAPEKTRCSGNNKEQ